MRMRLTVFFLAGCCAIGAAKAQDPTEKELNDFTNKFVECAGLYQWSSELSSRLNKPAASEHMQNMGRGAIVAGAYILSTLWNAQNIDKAGRPLGEWIDQLERQADAQKVRFAAIEESEDYDFLNKRLEVCVELSSAQEEVLTEVRNSYIR